MKFFLKFAVAAFAVFGFTPSVNAAAYKEAPVVNGGSVSGHVLLGSAKIETKSYFIAKNEDVCGSGSRNISHVRANGENLLDAVVFLEKVKQGKPFAAGTDKIRINQSGCFFQPNLAVMQNGGDLEAANADPILHNIHAYELIKKSRRTILNFSQSALGDKATKKIKLRRGDGMKVECDAHDFMHAYVFVAKNPYYSLVDKEGKFEITNIPTGQYIIKSWHGVLGKQTGTLTIEASGKVNINLSY